MRRNFGHQISSEMMLLWLCETIICFFIFSYGFSHSLQFFNGSRLEVIDIAAIFALVTGLVASMSGLYQPHACLAPWNLPAKLAVTTLLSILMIWLTSQMLGIRMTGVLGLKILWPVEFAVAWTGIVFATRLVFSLAVRMDLFMHRVVIIGSPEQAARMTSAMTSLQHGFFRVAATVPFEAGAQLSPDFFAREKVRDVIVSPDACAAMNEDDVALYDAAGIRIWRGPDFWERRLGRVDIEQEALHVGQRLTGRNLPSWLTVGASRFLDLALSVTLLIATLPVMLVTALLIKLEAPGPVFYRQERVGLGGRVFTLCKFRSMRVDAEERGPTWAAKRDSRVTRMGSIMRRTRIDELPQLLNVLVGEMSFIGPRPERPFFVDQIAQQVPFYGERSLVKPGLTGWAQVNFPYGASIEDARIKLSYDLYYVKHRSFFLDLLILFSTVRVILFQEGAR